VTDLCIKQRRRAVKDERMENTTSLQLLPQPDNPWPVWTSIDSIYIQLFLKETELIQVFLKIYSWLQTDSLKIS
jgi:hypothetical protein